MSIVITAIEKKGPVIICSTDDPKNRVYKLDFQNAKIYGITGKPVSSTCSIVDKIPPNITDNIFCSALFVFSNSAYSRETSYYGIVESLLSYPDLLTSRFDRQMLQYLHNNCNCKLPKGYVTWCRNNNKKFSLNTLKDFEVEQILQQWPQSLGDAVKNFYNGTNFNLAQMTNYDKELCMIMIRIINNSLKRYEIQDLTDCLYHILNALDRNSHLRSYLDCTKSARIVCQILDDVVNKKRNDKILSNEAKIASLNGTIINNLMIKVPSSMNDFIDEGEQQHNCVGYYYHDAMARGDTLIYFLRHIEIPDKSYVTCRYRIDKKKTIEHRLRNNGNFNDKELFKKIDDMIADTLK